MIMSENVVFIFDDIKVTPTTVVKQPSASATNIDHFDMIVKMSVRRNNSSIIGSFDDHSYVPCG